MDLVILSKAIQNFIAKLKGKKHFFHALLINEIQSILLNQVELNLFHRVH